MRKKKKQRVPQPIKKYLVLAILWVVVDQAVKGLVRSRILYRTLHPFLPGLDLTYVRNTGMAFSMFSSHTWLLALLSAVIAVALAVGLVKDFLPHWRGRLALALLLGGAVGNLIDRVFLGFVTDMFATSFINFAVFNVADVGVVVGGILLSVHLIFLWRDEGKAEKAQKEDWP